MKSISEVFSDNLKRFRKDRGITQAELGELAGIAGQSIANYEVCRTWPSLEIIAKIAKALQKNEIDLFAVHGTDAESRQAVVDKFSEILRESWDQTKQVIHGRQAPHDQAKNRPLLRRLCDLASAMTDLQLKPVVSLAEKIVEKNHSQRAAHPKKNR